ncbi:MAG: FHA domain-containing protein [Myxococcota bacterium]
MALSTPRTQVHALVSKVERHRALEANPCTRVSRAPRRHLPLGDPHVVFEFHRPVLANFVARHLGPGFLVAVADADGLAGVAWCKAGPRPRAVTIGRHTACDISLPGEDETALRQAVVVVRQSAEGRPRAKIFDLARLREMAADNAGHAVADRHLAPTGDHWLFVARTEQGRLVAGGAPNAFAEDSGPARAGELRFADGARVRLSMAQMCRGVLLGRYDCCVGYEHFKEEATSRIHALLVEDDGDPLLLDAGSTNGLVVNGERCTARVLRPGDWVRLGNQAFEWSRDGGAPETAEAPLFPEGVEEALALARRPGGHAVFADWLLERGSAWGEWIVAESSGDAARAAELKEALEPRLLGPLALLQARRWDRGILVEATLAGDEPIHGERALRWPLWAGLRRLEVAEERQGDRDRLAQSGALRFLDLEESP